MFASAIDLAKSSCEVFRPLTGVSSLGYLAGQSMTTAFSIKRDKISALIGPSGSGKTRAIQVIHEWFNNQSSLQKSLANAISFTKVGIDVTKENFLFIPITFGRVSPPHYSESSVEDMIKLRIFYSMWRSSPNPPTDSNWLSFIQIHASTYEHISLSWLLHRLKTLYSKECILIAIDEWHKLYTRGADVASSCLKALIKIHNRQKAFFIICSIILALDATVRNFINCNLLRPLPHTTECLNRMFPVQTLSPVLTAAEHALDHAKILRINRAAACQYFLYTLAKGHPRALVAVCKAIQGLQISKGDLRQLLDQIAHEYAEANENSSNSLTVSELTLVIALLGRPVTMDMEYNGYDELDSMVRRIHTIEELATTEGLVLEGELPCMSAIQLFSLSFPTRVENETSSDEMRVLESLIEMLDDTPQDTPQASGGSAPEVLRKTIPVRYYAEPSLAAHLQSLKRLVCELMPKKFEKVCLQCESILRCARKLMLDKYAISVSKFPNYCNMSLYELYGNGDMTAHWENAALRTDVKFDFTEDLVVAPYPPSESAHRALPTPQTCEKNELWNNIYYMYDENPGFAMVTFLRSVNGQWIALAEQDKFSYIDATQYGDEVKTSWTNTVEVLGRYGWSKNNIVLLCKTNRAAAKFHGQHGRNVIVLCKNSLKLYHGLTLTTMIESVTIFNREELATI